MQFRTEDVQAIVTAVEWIVEGELSEIRIRRDGELVFAARLKDDALQIDPTVMPPKLAKRLLNETDLLGGESSESDEPEAEAPKSGRSGRTRPQAGPKPRKASSAARV